MADFKLFWQRIYDTFIVPVKDYRVLGWTILLGILAHIIDPQGLQVMGIVLYVCFFWLLALTLRKILFPYRVQNERGESVQLKMSHFFKAALEGNIAAAIALCGMIFFMVAVAHSFMIWMR